MLLAKREHQATYYFTLPGSDVEFNVYYTIYFIDDATASAVCDKLVVGKKVDLTGIISVYSKDFQVYPDSANSVSNVRDVEYTDAEKVAMAKENLVITDSAKKDDVIELPAEGALGTTIAWAFAEGKSYEGLATLADGKLTIVATPDEATKIELVATITSGTVSDTKALEVSVAGATFDIINFADAVELCGTTKDQYTEDKYYMLGIIKEVTNTTYGNMTIVDEKGTEFTVYGTYDASGAKKYGEMENAPVAGDVIIVYGKLGYYNAPQMKNGWIVASYDVKSFAEAVELCGTTKDQYTEDKYYMIGTIKEVTNTTYGNMTIVDEKGTEFTVYGTYDASGANKYGEMENAPVAGNVIVVYGKLGYYNAPQMKNGWIVAVAPASATPSHTCESKCAICGGCEDAACTEEACATKCSCVAQDAPEAGTYVLKLVHTNLNKTLYFTGAMDGHYFATTEAEAEAIQVVLAKLENGKYTMAITVEGATKYLAIVPSGTYINVVMQEAAAEWTWNAKLGNFTIDVNGTAYFYGTSSTGTYTTISQRKLSDASTTCQANLVALSGGSTGGETPAPHTCESVCPTCQGCLDADCTEEACATKCPGHDAPAHTCESVCPTCQGCLDADCTEEACATKCEGHDAPEGITTIAGALAGKEGDKATFTGMVSGIYQNWDSYYGNMSVYVSDDQGNRIIVFRTTTQVGVGDIVTVNGTITIYQTTGIAQIAQGSTVTIDAKHECSDFTPASCLSAKICTVCGKADGEPLEHTDELDSNGKCDLCGEDMQSAAAQVTVTAKYTGTTTGNMATGNNAAKIGLDATIFNVTSAKPNGGNNLVGLNKAGNMRLYKNNTCTMTIAVAEGYQIVSVKVTLASSSTAKGNLVVTNGTDTLAVTNGMYMINGSTVVFSNSGSDQVHIASIEIVYAPVAQ